MGCNLSVSYAALPCIKFELLQTSMTMLYTYKIQATAGCVFCPFRQYKQLAANWGMLMFILQNHQTNMFPGLLSLKTLVVKMFSVTLSMAGGLIAGKEGPFIHAGGIVGGGWASMGSR